MYELYTRRTHAAYRLVQSADSPKPDSPNLEKVHSMSKINAVVLWKKSYSVILSLRNIPKMVNGFRYYRALESVSIASALSTALTIYPCQIRVHQR